MTQHPASFLVVAGLIIAGIGVVWLLAPSIPWLGKLPGDINVERENFVRSSTGSEDWKPC